MRMSLKLPSKRTGAAFVLVLVGTLAATTAGSAEAPSEHSAVTVAEASDLLQAAGDRAAGPEGCGLSELDRTFTASSVKGTLDANLECSGYPRVLCAGGGGPV